jgi:predicted PurR-regulated permease PerM
LADLTPAPRSLAELPQFRALISMLAVLCAAALLYLSWQVLSRLAHLLTLLLFAALLAFLIGPAVTVLERRGMPRALAVLGIYLLIAGGIALGIALAVGPLTDQAISLSRQLPQYQTDLNRKLTALDTIFSQRHIPFHPSDLTKQGVVQGVAKATLNDAVSVLTALASVVVDAVLTLVMSIYLLTDARRIHDNLLRLVPVRHRDRAFFVEAAVTRVLGGYIRGQLLMALLIGAFAGLGCLVLGVHYPLVIGVLAGLFELMPMIGPILGAIPAVAIAFFQSPVLALWVALYYLIIQQLEAHVIGPRITGHAVGLHPLGAIIALIAGVELYGLLGALLGVPVAGILYVLGVAIYWEATGRGVPVVRRTTPLQRARELVWRSTAAPAGTAPGARAHVGKHPPAPTSEALPSLRGATIPAPQALAGLEEEAAMLRVHFENSEGARAQEHASVLAEAAVRLEQDLEKASSAPVES